MRYMGGKVRIGKQIASIIQQFDPVSYHEPFCGMFSVGKHIVCPTRTASDLHPDLILLLQAIQNGWEPPARISEKVYAAFQNTNEPSAMRGFVGFGCSFYGKFFGGYARDKFSTNYAELACNSLRRLRPSIQDVVFAREDYRNYSGNADIIYCDPPYSGTTDYSNGTFGTEEFWEWVRRQSARKVFVSEYIAPTDFVSIWEKPVTTSMKSKTGYGFARTEKLFVHRKFT